MGSQERVHSFALHNLSLASDFFYSYRKWKRDSEVRAAEAAQKQRPRAGRQTREEPVYLNNDADLAAWLVPDNEVEFVDDDSDYEADELSAMDTTNRLRSRPRRDRGQGQR